MSVVGFIAEAKCYVKHKFECNVQRYLVHCIEHTLALLYFINCKKLMIASHSRKKIYWGEDGF